MRVIRFESWVGLAALLLAPAAARAQTYSFDVQPKLVNIAFESRMDIEDIFGSSNRIGGWLKIRERNKIHFKLEVPVDSLKTGIAMRDDHLRSETWLNAGKHPAISFEGKSVRKVGKHRYEVKGTFTLRGRKRPLKLTVQAREIPRARATKLGLGDADWLRVRGSFKVKLSDHGIRIPKMAAAKVSDTWTVRVSLFAKRAS
jgi:polyisoprenoid-binding protein YceI